MKTYNEFEKKQIQETQNILDHIYKKEDIQIFINDLKNMWNHKKYNDYPKQTQKKIIEYIVQQKENNNFGKCTKHKPI